MVVSMLTNTAAMQALQALSANSQGLATTQDRISTGLKVSSAKDDGATYAIAQKMRARVASMDVVSQSLNRGSSILDVAASAAASVSDLLAQMKEKALEYSDTSLDTVSRGDIRQDLRDLVGQISTAVSNASFDGVNLLSGASETSATYTYGASVLPSISTSQTFDGKAGFIDVSFSSENVGFYSADVTGGQRSAATNVMNSADTPSLLTGAQLPYGEELGADRTPIPSTVSFSYSSTPLAGATQYGITGLSITDESYIDPAIVTSPDGSTQSLGAKPMTPQLLGLGDIGAANLYDSYGNALGADTLSPMFMSAVDNAASTVQTYVAEIGNEQNLLDGMRAQNSKLIDAISAGVGNLVDADMGAESANLQAEQARQALGTQALSIANQQSDWILKLFR